MNALSWIYSFIIIVSVYLIGDKNRWGWMVANIGALGFIYLYIKTGLYGGIALDVFLLFFNTRNFFKWTRDMQLDVRRPFYIKLISGHGFKLHDTLVMGEKSKCVIIDDVCADAKWKAFFRNLRMTKLFRFFGIDINNHVGELKVQPLI
jgi:hypothetical protein